MLNCLQPPRSICSERTKTRMLDRTAMTADYCTGTHDAGQAAPQGRASLRVKCVQRGPADLLKLERAKGFEPSTPTLARSCSTPELHPHPLGMAASRQGRSYSQKPQGFATTAEKRH